MRKNFPKFYFSDGRIDSKDAVDFAFLYNLNLFGKIFILMLKYKFKIGG